MIERLRICAFDFDTLFQLFAGLLSAGRGFVGYWVTPMYKQGINLTVSCLLHFFRIVLGSEGRLPPILFLQLDNAQKDNKHKVMPANF